MLRIDRNSFFVAGRFERLPRSRVERELAARAGKLHRRITQRTDFAVITHEAVGRIDSPAIKALLGREPWRCISEETFLRALGLAAPLLGKDIHADRFQELAALAPEDVRLLALFDILAPVDGRFGFGDLKIAQHVAKLRHRGVAIENILAAATALRRRRRGSGPQEFIRLDIAPGGDLMMRIGETLAELDGQMRFAWVQPPPDPDALFEAAEQAASAGELLAAERLYYACLSASPRDPVVRFNLGNTVRDLGRAAEAKAHYLAAVDAEPGFAEAHFNLGHLAMGTGQHADAIAHFEHAVLADPDFSDPLYNLAALYIQSGRLSDAAPLLERYVKLDPTSKWGHEARKLLLACKAVLAPKRAAARKPVASQTVPG
ncbi:MAG: tetratricopeptide repeat protein [Stellaceae bacterium]